MRSASVAKARPASLSGSMATIGLALVAALRSGVSRGICASSGTPSSSASSWPPPWPNSS